MNDWRKAYRALAKIGRVRYRKDHDTGLWIADVIIPQWPSDARDGRRFNYTDTSLRSATTLLLRSVFEKIKADETDLFHAFQSNLQRLAHMRERLSKQ